MKTQVIQYEYQGIPDAPVLCTDEAGALTAFENLVSQDTYWRKRKEEETGTEYYAAYCDYLHEEGSESKHTVRWWVLGMTLNESEHPEPSGLLEAAKSAAKVLLGIVDKLYVPHGVSVVHLDEEEINQIFVDSIQELAELDQAIAGQTKIDHTERYDALESDVIAELLQLLKKWGRDIDGKNKELFFFEFSTAIDQEIDYITSDGRVKGGFQDGITLPSLIESGNIPLPDVISIINDLKHLLSKV